MDATIKQVAGLYGINTWLLHRTIKDLTDDEMFMRPGDKGNPAQFILGHITSSRFSVAKLLGHEGSFAHGKLYERGVEVGERADYPPVSDSVAAWDAISKIIAERLHAATAEQLDAEAPFSVGDLEKTVRGAVSFLILHESYHIGQLAYIRRLLGHDQPVG